ncbi:OmpA family protein [Snodgrassella sp. CFCC 13594]|uniref:OmpA family protein n=1 Tax=Snodgrassella sp. CFCC 13594 TaxID=1775559 RepID=UPI00082DF8A2|nr:OmpA family protein [Snodgrassella sp. CFCC 13594]
MEHSNNNQDQGIGKWVAALLVLIALVLAFFGGMILLEPAGNSMTTVPASSAAATSDTATGDTSASATAPASATQADHVVVDNGVVKFYFASGSNALAADANTALADVVAGAKEGKKVVISGFHDSTGDAKANAEVSKQRAQAVEAAVVALGVSSAQIELRKPQDTEGSGNAAEARRVEVSLE